MENLVNPSPEFWRGKRVLVTGHTGFKGAWLTLWLRRLGAEVHGFSLPPATSPNLACLCGLDGGGSSVIGDICDPSRVDEAYAVARPELVLHLAAQALVRRSYRDPIETFATNVMGTLQVLRSAAATSSTRAVVVVTTDKCYENKEWIWSYRENEALGGHDPYSASKACTEIAVAAWRASSKDMPVTANRPPLSIATARAGNVIGGGDWAEDRLIPDFVRALTAKEDLLVRNPHATRPWQHVLEPLAGYLLLAERLWRGEAQEAWNFGPALDDIRPVEWVVKRLCREWGPDARWSLAGGEHPHEASYLALDAAKARVKLDWSPRLPLADALAWTCDWYRRQQLGECANALTIEQIEKYQALANEVPA